MHSRPGPELGDHVDDQESRLDRDLRLGLILLDLLVPASIWSPPLRHRGTGYSGLIIEDCSV